MAKKNFCDRLFVFANSVSVQVFPEKEKTKAEKAKNKAAMLRIKELEEMVKNLKAQLKTA